MNYSELVSSIFCLAWILECLTKKSASWLEGDGGQGAQHSQPWQCSSQQWQGPRTITKHTSGSATTITTLPPQRSFPLRMSKSLQYPPSPASARTVARTTSASNLPAISYLQCIVTTCLTHEWRGRQQWEILASLHGCHGGRNAAERCSGSRWGRDGIDFSSRPEIWGGLLFWSNKKRLESFFPIHGPSK